MAKAEFGQRRSVGQGGLETIQNKPISAFVTH
jgi:hypothetical protein